MIICHSRKFIFFSNPKTGSETVRAMLEPWSEEPIVPFTQRLPERPFYPHMSPIEAEWTFDALGWCFDKYTTITCVRNPYDRLVSLYRMIQDVDGLWQIRRSLGLGQPSFSRWVSGTRPNGRGGGGRSHQKWRRYGTWSAQHWCANRVDHVLRLENLSEDIDPVLAALGISPSDLPHLNGRGPVDPSEWYDENLNTLVAKRYEWDLEKFGYERPKLVRAA